MDINPLRSTTIGEWYSRIVMGESVEVGAGSATQNPGDRVTLSRSSSIETYLYSAQDILNILPAPLDAADNTVAQKAAQESSATGANETGSLSAWNHHAAFLEIIKNQVQYLLEALINAQGNGDLNSSAQPDPFAAKESSSSVGTANMDYWSPEQTASRIAGFALAFYDGGDREEYAAMVKDAVMKGYNEAQKAAGGSLPDVANQTISLVMDTIDQFASGNGLDVVA